MTFTKWLDTLIAEKNINVDHMFTVDGMSGPNMMNLQIVIDAIKAAPAREQAGIKNMLVKIDFVNGSVADYLKHLAQAIAI